MKFFLKILFNSHRIQQKIFHWQQ